MRGAWDLTRKDLKLLSRDRRAVALLLFLPLAFIAILGMTTGQFLTRSNESRRLTIMVVKQTDDPLAAQFVTDLEHNRSIDVTTASDLPAARQSVERGQATIGLVIGADFAERVDALDIGDILNSRRGPLAAGLPALDLQILSRPATLTDAALLDRLIFAEALRSILPTVASKNAIARRWVKSPDDEEESGTTKSPEHTEEAVAPEANPSGDAQGQAVYRILVPGFTVMFVFFLVNIMARSFIAERDLGTLRRLRLAPLSTVDLLLGKTIPFFLVSLAQCGLLFFCGRLLFGMSWGPAPVWLIPAIISTSLAATSLGLLLATVVKTDQQVSAYGTSLVLILGGISGCFLPREWLPPLMKSLSLATPHAWALSAFDAVLVHESVDGLRVLQCCGGLALFAAVFFGLGVWRFRVSPA